MVVVPERRVDDNVPNKIALSKEDTTSTQGEQHIRAKLTEKFNPTTLRVQDVSVRAILIIGGCGDFYAITIASEAFKGLTMIKQHRLVTETLKKEIEGIHGLQIQTHVE
ncbi:bola-like protein [Lentinula novae-zelandiae]|nr:bola-like protein [Lentinula novae-zelandiae]